MYATGGFNFPTSTGDYSVTGLGFQPQAVLFFGGNKATVGTLMTGLTGPGLFASLNARDYATPSTVRSFAVAINGNSGAANMNLRALATGPITMSTDSGSAGTLDYRAGSITFDSNGFTINVSTAASGVRPIHWLAWGGSQAQTGMVRQLMTGTLTFANSYNPLSAIVLSTIAGSGFTEGSVDDEAWFSWGSGHYPAYTGGSPVGWRSSTLETQVMLGLGQAGFTDSAIFNGVSGIDQLNISGVVSTVVGPVPGNRRHRPDATGAGLSTMNNNGGGDSPFQGAVWWNGEGWTGTVSSPATITTPPAFNRYEAMVFSTINGNDQSGTGAPLRFGFGVLTNDYQGCVVFGPDGSFYQSTSECLATCTSSAVNAASGVINVDGTVTLTTTKGTAPAGVYHGFGPFKFAGVPQIYRRVFR